MPIRWLNLTQDQILTHTKDLDTLLPMTNRDQVAVRLFNSVTMTLESAKLLQYLANSISRRISWTDQHFSKTYGITKQSFLNLERRTDPLLRYPKPKESTYFQTIMLKGTPGIIDSMHHTIHKGWCNCLVEKIHSYINLRSFSIDHSTGQLYGYLILTIGQEINMICFQCGCFPLPIARIWLKNIRGR